MQVRSGGEHKLQVQHSQERKYFKKGSTNYYISLGFIELIKKS